MVQYSEKGEDIHRAYKYKVFSCHSLPDFLSKLIGIHPVPSPLCPVGQTIHQVLAGSYKKIKDDLSSSLNRITMEDILADYYELNKRHF